MPETFWSGIDKQKRRRFGGTQSDIIRGGGTAIMAWRDKSNAGIKVGK